MLRLLSLGLVAGLTLVSGPAERKPLTKQEYVTLIRALDDETTELFDKVVNHYWYGCRLGPCSDTNTSVGTAWLASERHLRARMNEIADRLTILRPPADVVTLHAAWIPVIHSCSRRLQRLEGDLQVVDNIDVIDVFEKKVAYAVDDSCFDRFDEIVHAFEAKGYEFY
jgi:hypothetical protein